ncbi:glycosyltransferase family 4 protein [Gulosibacter chungangensis]|uniref:Glycosyltransferase family 4 protein n=1 Tax=Gulosibacter chungangensis TaxID=979746 RepID=A0A7J5BHC4_9MICO|nr:glycosyltransferase family 1 protein [Gulosibacter chungangensis]KAB1645020.1 glycosyltransferase family 4 protein [Gulosibacter chungangensis]
MRFFFDARYIRTDFHDGISRYSAQLGNAVHAQSPDEVTFLIHDERQLEHLPTGAKWLLFHSNESALEPIAAFKLNNYRPDVVFSPLQTIGTTGRKYKAIVTLHDLIYYRHRKPPTHLNPLLRLGWRAYHLTYGPQRLALNGADAVATVSETTKREILAAKLTKRPVVVIPNAPNDLRALLPEPAATGQTNATGQTKPTERIQNLVYMGSFMPYKGVETLIAGMADLPGRALHLLSRIKPERRRELEALVPAGADVVFHEGVSDEEYARLLANNAVLVTASLDEGYGLPLAEALALGTPAVVTDLEIFHEVAGPGARYFAREDARDFAAQVQALDDPEVRAATIAAGLKHMERFTWERSARILWETARSLAGGRR